MIFILISMLFLLIGVWEHGRKLAGGLFLLLLAVGVWDLQRPEPRLGPSLMTAWRNVVGADAPSKPSKE